MSEDNPVNFTPPVPEGVQHGPYPPMTPEEEAKMSQDVDGATGYKPQPEDSQTLQEAHQLEQHQEAIAEAQREGRIDEETADGLKWNVDRVMGDQEATLLGKASEQQEAENLAGQGSAPVPDENTTRTETTELSAEQPPEPSRPEDHESMPESDAALLALSVIDRQLKEANAELLSAQRHLRFVKGYRPTPPGPRPHPDAGGMDHEDWNVARLEYAQYDEQEEEDGALQQLDNAEEAVYNLEYNRDAIMEGDDSIIEEIVAAERARLAEQARKEARAVERETGKEFEGSKELFDSLRSLIEDKDYTEHEKKTGPNGWVYKYTVREGIIFEFGHEKGPARQFLKELRVSNQVQEDGSVRVSLHEIPENARSTGGGFDDLYIYNTEAEAATITEDGLVKHQTHYKGASWRGSLSSPLRPPHPMHVGDKAKELDFRQVDFDKLKDAVNGVRADMQSLSEQQPVG